MLCALTAARRAAQAFAALQLPPASWGSADAAKAAYRRLSVRWHPDKNPGDAARAQAVFVRVAAAYHTLTTANFDYKRCAACVRCAAPRRRGERRREAAAQAAPRKRLAPSAAPLASCLALAAHRIRMPTTTPCVALSRAATRR